MRRWLPDFATCVKGQFTIANKFEMYLHGEVYRWLRASPQAYPNPRVRFYGGPEGNPKVETRNPKEARNPNQSASQRRPRVSAPSRSCCWSRPSGFGLRIS